MTKGQLEAKLSEAIIRFEVDYMGRGPTNIRTYVLNDMIIARLYGFLNPSEKKLIESVQGVVLLKKMRASLFEGGRGYLESLIRKIIDVPIISTYSDISTKTNEKIIMLVVDCNLEELASSIK